MLSMSLTRGSSALIAPATMWEMETNSVGNDPPNAGPTPGQGTVAFSAIYGDPASGSAQDGCRNPIFHVSTEHFSTNIWVLSVLRTARRGLTQQCRWESEPGERCLRRLDGSNEVSALHFDSLACQQSRHEPCCDRAGSRPMQQCPHGCSTTSLVLWDTREPRVGSCEVGHYRCPLPKGQCTSGSSLDEYASIS
jgi:hypothetical protein